MHDAVQLISSDAHSDRLGSLIENLSAELSDETGRKTSVVPCTQHASSRFPRGSGHESNALSSHSTRWLERRYQHSRASGPIQEQSAGAIEGKLGAGPSRRTQAKTKADLRAFRKIAVSAHTTGRLVDRLVRCPRALEADLRTEIAALGDSLLDARRTLHGRSCRATGRGACADGHGKKWRKAKDAKIMKNARTEKSRRVKNAKSVGKEFEKT